jgi:DNA end-binding protein Ku
LRETLKSTGRIAVAQVVIRTVQHLAAVVPHERALMLNTLRYQDELKDPTGIELPAEGLKAAGVSPKEVDLAKQLVDGMTQPWEPENFKDSYHDDLMARIKEKIKLGQTKEITQPEKGAEGKPRSAQVIDLMDLLKQSLDKSGGHKEPKRADGASASKPKLRVVARTPSTKRAVSAEKARPAQRKRA